MHDVEMKVQEICALKDDILKYTKSGVTCDQLDIAQAGQTVDMVKDLCDAEKNLWKAAYYKAVVMAMQEAEEGEEMYGGRMGYDHWRNSKGQYAPKGTGHWTPIRGYTPTPWMDDPDQMAMMDWDGARMMGYDNQGGGNRSQGGPNSTVGAGRTGSSGGRMGYSDPDMERYLHDERHGRPYRDWQLSRKHYTETKSEGDRKEMTEHAKEHLADTVTTVREIWADATPELREKMKKDFTALMAEMK